MKITQDKIEKLQQINMERYRVALTPEEAREHLDTLTRIFDWLIRHESRRQYNSIEQGSSASPLENKTG